jgi:chromosome segregation protein
MDIDDVLSTRGSETERNNPGAILNQMKDKLRSQNAQIRVLETYKGLCEQRILDLYPNHPLPVEKEHLGCSVYSETLPLKQKISKLEEKLSNYCDPYLLPGLNSNQISSQSQSLYSKYCILEKEKSEVEESLRNEVRMNEEQRSYIEVLKQALEINMEQLGLQGLTIEDFLSFTSLKTALEEKNKEFWKLKNKFNDLEYQNYALQDLIEVRNQEISELSNQSEANLKELQSEKNSCKSLKNELERIEEEKSRLIDYIDNTLQTEQKATSQLKELTEKLENLQKELEKSKDKERNLGVDKRIALEKVEELKNLVKILENQKNSLEKKSESLEIQLEENREELEKGQVENEKMKESLKESTEVIKKLKGEVISKEKELEKIRIENICTKELLEQTENLLQRTYSEKNELENLKKIINQLTDSNKIIAQQLESNSVLLNQETLKNQQILVKLEEKEKFLKLNSLKLEDLNKDHQFELESLKKQISELKSENDSKSLQISSQLLQVKSLEASEMSIRTENQILLSKIESLSKTSHSNELETLKSEFQSLHSRLHQNQFSEQSEKLQSQTETILRLTQENLALTETTSRTFEDLKLLYSSFGKFWSSGSLIQLLQALSQETLSLLQKFSIQQSEIDTLSQSSKQYSSQLSRLEQTLASIKTENLLLKSKSEKQVLEVNFLTESLKNQVGSLQAEISVLRSNLKKTSEDLEKSENLMRKMQMEATQLKFKLVSVEVNLQSAEEKYSLVLDEKKHLLQLIQKVQNALKSDSLQNSIHEILRIHSELEYCSLEKLRISMQLRKSDISEGSGNKVLNQQLEDCQLAISRHLLRLSEVETEILF